MRITCQNCRAQYEIAANEIPALGCEVECLGCGKVWYQWPDRESSARATGQSAIVQDEFAEDAPRSLDAVIADAAPENGGSKPHFEFSGSTVSSRTPQEVARILEEEFIESTKIGKMGAGVTESVQDQHQGDEIHNSKWSKETRPKHRFMKNENSIIRRSGSPNSDNASVRRHQGDEAGSDLFRYGILPILLLAIFLGLIHFTLPIAGELFEEVRPYAKAYETVFGRALENFAMIFDAF